MAPADNTEQRTRVNRSLLRARAVQLGMLPDAPVLPELEIGVHYEACEELGGDFYDFIQVSPTELGIVLADVSGLCPALFSVGTRDLLLDDTLMMAPLWAAAGNDTELGVFPGGAHVFQAFPGKLAQDGLRRIDDFLNAAIAAA